MEQDKEIAKKEPVNIFNNKKILIAILLVNFLFKLYIALQPIEYIDSIFIPDDSYLSLTLAKNIANGMGPMYGADYTNGFQPLYVFVMVPVYMVFNSDLITPIKASLIILIIFDTLSLFFLLKLLSENLKSAPPLILASVIWVLNAYIIATTLNALETSISLFFIILSLYYYLKIKRNELFQPKQYLIMGVILGCAALARIDNLFLALSFFVFTFFNSLRQKEGNKLLLRKLLIAAAGLFVCYSPWLIYSFVYTGDLFPISGKAVRLESLAQLNGQAPTFSDWYSLLLQASWKIIFENNTVLIFLFILLLILIIPFWKGQLKENVLSKLSNNNFLLLSMLALFSAYNFYIYGYWFYIRYFYPIVLLLIIYCTLVHDYLNYLIDKPKALKAVNMILPIIVAVSLILQPQFKRLFYDKEYLNNGYMNIGLWVSKSFKDGTIVGCAQSGAVGYFAQNLKIVNLDGVVNKKCYESLVQKRNMEYIKETKVDHIIGWQSNFTLIQNQSSNFQNSDLTFRGRIGEFRTWGFVWLLAKVNY